MKVKLSKHNIEKEIPTSEKQINNIGNLGS